MDRETAERCTILRGLVGSTVHGLNVNDGIEDRDEMGICVEPLEFAMSLFEPFAQFIYRTAAEREGHANARSTGARRVRDALRPGGLVVIEAGVTDEPESPMGYRPGELRSLFEGFQILKYEETTGKYDWGRETIRLVRLVEVKK